MRKSVAATQATHRHHHALEALQRALRDLQG
jgi:hypothetical protein